MGWSDDPSPVIAPAPETSLELTPAEAELLDIYRIVNDQGKALITGNARMISGMDEYRK